MRASEMVAELLRMQLRQPTPANAANPANGPATPSSPRLRMLANACESAPQPEQVAPTFAAIRSHSQPQQTQAQPSDSQDSQVSQATGSTIATQRRRLIAAAIAQGIDAGIIAALDDADVDGCQWLDEPGLLRYAQIVQENYLREHGAIPLRPVRREAARSVNCATCAHQQRRPDTSPSGMHGCGKGHGMHFAYEQHACTDWQPRP